MDSFRFNEANQTMSACKNNTVFVAVALVLLCGCRDDFENRSISGPFNEVRSSEILNLHRGISIDEVEEGFHSKGRHQFSAILPEGIYHCISYSFEKPYIYYYFLYKETNLEKIVTPPSPEVELIPYKNVSREVKKAIDPEKRIDKVLNSESLTAEDLLISLRKELSMRKESFNILPAFLLTSEYFEQAAEDIRSDYKRNEFLARKFDPGKINLGDGKQTVLSVYGSPLNISKTEQNSQEIYRFGSNEPLRINPAYRFSNIAVVFKDDHVTRIFSNDFLVK